MDWFYSFVQKISSTVRLTHGNLPNYNIDYQVTKCDGKTENAQECADLKKSKQAEFEVSINAIACPTNKNDEQKRYDYIILCLFVEKCFFDLGFQLHSTIGPYLKLVCKD